MDAFAGYFIHHWLCLHLGVLHELQPMMSFFLMEMFTSTEGTSLPFAVWFPVTQLQRNILSHSARCGLSGLRIWTDDSFGLFRDFRKSNFAMDTKESDFVFGTFRFLPDWNYNRRCVWFAETTQQMKLSVKLSCPRPLQEKKSAHSNRVPPSLLCLLWLDPCCLDTVHTAVRLGHSQASEESGVNGTRKWLVIFLSNWVVFIFGSNCKKNVSHCIFSELWVVTWILKEYIMFILVTIEIFKLSGILQF